MYTKNGNLHGYPAGVGVIKTEAVILAHLLARFVSRLDICICLFHNQTAILSGHVQAINVRQFGGLKINDPSFNFSLCKNKSIFHRTQ